MNAFQAGSNADISMQNIDMTTGMLKKENSKPNIAKNNGFMLSGNEEVYVTSISTAQITDSSNKSNKL